MRKAKHGAPLAFAKTRGAGGDPTDQCVLWPFHRKMDGYGRITINGRVRPAHQLVLELSGRPKPNAESEVRHLCANRLCVNLAHLVWGSRSENQRDRFRVHGDTMRGARNPRARLTESQVKEIRQRLAAGGRVKDEAARFRVSRATISLIKSGATWRAD